MSPYITGRRVGRPRRRVGAHSAGRRSRQAEPVLDVVDLGLDALDVFCINLEQPVLGTEQQDALEYQLQPLAVPFFKGACKDLREVLIPSEWLAELPLGAGEVGKL